MPSYRTPRPGSKWYLPRPIYRHVVSFCQCYPMWKHASAATGISAVQYDGMPHGTNIGDPTAQAAMRIYPMAEKCRLIEETVREVAPEIYKWLLNGVTNEGMTYESLRYRHGMPCGRGMYFAKRREFYYKLSEKL